MNAKIKKAINTIVLRHEAFAPAAMALPWVERVGVGTACTDGENVYYEPSFIDKLSNDQVVGLVLHELCHPFLGHLMRLAAPFQSQPQIANMAADFELNQFLVEYNSTVKHPIILPDGACHDPVRFGNRACESIFKELMQDAEQAIKDGGGNSGVDSNGSDSGGDSNGSDGGDSNGSDGDSDSNSGDGGGGSNGSDGDGDSNSGSGDDDDGDSNSGSGGSSGSGGKAQPQSSNPLNHKSFGEFRPPSDPQKRQELADKWQEIRQSCIQVAKMKGNASGTFWERLENIDESPVDPEELLSRYVDEFVMDDESTNMDRRYMANYDIFVVGMESERCGTLVFVKDTSGSIDTATLQSCVSVIQRTCDRVRFKRLVVMDADTKVQDVAEYEPHDEIELSAKGRGGTDFRPAFDYVAEHYEDARVLIYLTDGYGPFPSSAPDIPTLWISYGIGAEGFPFGEVVDLKDIVG